MHSITKFFSRLVSPPYLRTLVGRLAASLTAPTAAARSLAAAASALAHWLGGPGSAAPLALAGAPLAAPAPAPATVWDGILLAAPKKKVSHSRKAMRAANKGLRDRTNLVHCPGCGRPKLQHHLCEHCYADMSRQLKRAHV